MEEKNCLICLGPIDNPICVNCYIDYVKAWMEAKNIHLIVKEFVISSLESEFLEEEGNAARCVICDRESVNVCFNCFSYIFSVLLNEINLPDSVVEEFLETFRYNLSSERRF
jgi:hypothetical protein